MKLDVSQALRNPGQEYPFHVVQAIAPMELGGTTSLLMMPCFPAFTLPPMTVTSPLTVS